MAFLEDDESQPQGSQTVSAQPMTTGGAGGAYGNTTVAPGGMRPMQAAPPSDSSGTGWTNIQSYLNANQSQAAGMGQQIANNVNTQAQNAQTGVNNLSQNFASQVGQATTNYDPNQVNNDISAALGMTSGSTFNPSYVSNFSNFANASYIGPTNLDQENNYGTVSNNLNNALNTLSETGSEAGRDQLLQAQYGNDSANGYTQGENALDQGLVEGSEAAQKDLSNVASNWSGLGDSLNNANTQGLAGVTQARGTDAATRQAAAAALGQYGSYTAPAATGQAGTYSGGSGALGTFGQGLYNNFSKDLGAYTGAQGQIASSEATDNWTPELSTLGLNPNMNTYGVKLNANQNYIKMNGVAPTLANASSADNYAQQAALDQLAGALPGGAASVGGSGLLTPAESAQAGTGDGVNGGPLYGLTTGSSGTNSLFQQDVENAQSLYDSGQPLQNAVTSYFGSLPTHYQPTISSWNPSTGNADISYQTYVGLGQRNPATIVDPIDTIPGTPGYANPNIGITTPLPNLDYNTIFSYPLDPSIMDGSPGALAASAPWQTMENMRYSTLADPNASGPATTSSSGSHIAGTPLSRIAMAFGGFPTPGGKGLVPADKLLKEHIVAVPSEPGVPAIPAAHAPLPRLPHFAEGGKVPVKYPVHNEIAAKESLERVNKSGSDMEKNVVRRQVAARYPHLARGGDVLDTTARKDIATKNFAIPSQRKYPIENIDHARNALARVSEYGTAAQKKEVRDAVHEKYKSLATGGDVLTEAKRNKIPTKEFAVPGERKYPIENIAHARNALARVAQFGSPAEQAQVRKAVAARYPSLMADGGEAKPLHDWSNVLALVKTPPDQTQPYKAGGKVPKEPWMNIGDSMRAAGGKVPGTPKVDHNSYSNDGVAARLSSGEIVLPLSVTQSKDPVKAAAEFVANLLKKGK